MSPLQSRRAEAQRLITDHLKTHGPTAWAQVRAQLPDMPAPTFWRNVRDVKRRILEADRQRALVEKSNSIGVSFCVPFGMPLRVFSQEYRRPIHPSAFSGRPSKPSASHYRLVGFPNSRAVLRPKHRANERNARSKPNAATAGAASATGAPRQMTVGELFTIYDAEVLSKLRNGQSTRRSLAIITDALADRTCSNLVPSDIEPIVAELVCRAPIHANRALAYFSGFCGWAKRREQMPYNITRLVKKPVDEAPRDRLLSLDEILEIWMAAEELGRPYGTAIQVLILTGARREEVAKMRGRSVKLIRHPKEPKAKWEWHILDHRHGQQQPFIAPLSPQAAGLALAAYERVPYECEFVFTSTGIAPISNWSRAKRKLDAIIRARRQGRHGETAEEMPPWRINDLRSSFVALAGSRLEEYAPFIRRCRNTVSHLRSPSQIRWDAGDWTIDNARGVVNAWANLIDQELDKRARLPNA